MKFGPLPVAEAEGAILAHATPAMGRAGPGGISKGTRLTAAHIAGLIALGIGEVTVARFEEGDVGEDPAALSLAGALARGCAALRLTEPRGGRVNLHATEAGIVRLDVGRLDAVNRISPDLTVATVPPFRRVAAGDLVATIKIIPFGTGGRDLARAEDTGRGGIGVMGAALRRACLIETRTGAGAPGQKGRASTRKRLERFGTELEPRVVVPHRVEDLARALSSAQAPLVLILTGSATSDIRDVAPEALRRAGGTVLHYGMPVDPGNLLFLGRLGPSVVIGLPGCARSPAMNGADWVMDRVICGVAPEAIDIAGMGVGGLLKEIPSRPRPREATDRPRQGSDQPDPAPDR